MAATKSFSLPDGDSVLEDVIKMCGRDGISTIIRNALHHYKDSIRANGKSCIPLPSPKSLQDKLLEAKEIKTIEDVETNLKHLLTVTKKTLEYRKGVIKFDL